MKNKIVRGVTLVVLLAMVTTFGGACGLESSETNEIGLVYSGGWTEDKEYQGILRPGATNNSTGYGSTTYRYRTDQRSMITDIDLKAPIVVSKDVVQLSVPFQLYFKLNQDEKILRKFHENLGVKTKAWTNDGWKQMLNEYFAPQIERSLEAAALKHDWKPLYASEDARKAFETDSIALIKQAITEVIGDEYFCGPAYTGAKGTCGDFTLTVGKPSPINAEIVAAIEAEQTARAETIAQEQKNAKIRAELEAERELVALYGPQGALLREAIRSGKVTQIIVDSTGRVSVPTGR